MKNKLFLTTENVTQFLHHTGKIYITINNENYFVHKEHVRVPLEEWILEEKAKTESKELKKVRESLTTLRNKF